MPADIKTPMDAQLTINYNYVITDTKKNPAKQDS